ncbi:MAG: Pilus assembly protein [Chloroflexi bacterium]|jgi:pilus assembly protein Flp/PilA|nr:Pilus assembly protein [Chloroflexota bacterium]
MLDFKKLFQKSNEEEEGQGLVEYALILFLVAVVVIAILILLGPQIGSVFSAVTKGLS